MYVSGREGDGRSRRDCGNLEAADGLLKALAQFKAAVAATAAILRRISCFKINVTGRQPQSPRLRQS